MTWLADGLLGRQAGRQTAAAACPTQKEDKWARLRVLWHAGGLADRRPLGLKGN
jgi:hypothetical protein